MIEAPAAARTHPSVMQTSEPAAAWSGTGIWLPGRKAGPGYPLTSPPVLSLRLNGTNRPVQITLKSLNKYFYYSDMYI